MMTKQKEQSELKEVINSSGIFNLIETLEIKFKAYQRLEIAKMERYVIHQEFAKMNREMEHLKCQLEQLIELSLIWERD